MRRVYHLLVVGSISLCSNFLLPVVAVESDAPEVAKSGADGLMAAALHHLDAGDMAAALGRFKEAIAVNNAYVPALLGAAMVCADAQQHAEAFDFYDQVLRQDPQHALAWNGRGLAAFNLGRINDAIDSFAQSVKRQPVNGFFYESLAWAHMCAMDAPSAIQAAKESLLMYSQTEEASIYPTLIIYFCSLEQNDAQNARRAMNYALKNSKPKQWPSPVIHYLNGSLDRSELLSYVVNSAEETEAHVYIGLNLSYQNKVDQAHQHLEWAATYGDSAVFEYSLARSLVSRAPRLVAR